ncbi:chlorophyll a/b-binding protein [Leptolyngbya sp. FACHB-261]|uniref:chlorophyll a/b-binding protein n=1 Tax=Leptolyngbya sp. FACHB-261 TaxID=2692806 RepID=UPI001683DAE6|nr:chlorophyll a/b-binding protein [Leptolyngbya sp. FACHB-261]MBD2101971.1 high light inducible protein [Leptolyngbya sp. FACHB-261]
MPEETHVKPVATVTDPADANYDRNAPKPGITAQAEIWNGRLAMIGFLAYLLWDWAGVNVAHDLFHLVSAAPPIQ